jgi:peptidoglycan/xylan/chitin deacetylase (PgdA/CDA1 family)
MVGKGKYLLVSALVLVVVTGFLLIKQSNDQAGPRLAHKQEYQLDPPGLADLEIGDVEPGVPVLCYHYFRKSFDAGYLLKVLGSVFFGMPALGAKEFWTTPVGQFEKHLQYFRDTNTRTMTLGEVAALYERGDPIPERAVVITMDDADISVYKHAWPLLKKYGVKAHIFVPTGMVGTKWSSLNVCSWEQLKEMSDSGHVLVESHTRSLHFKIPTDNVPEPVFLHAGSVPEALVQENATIISNSGSEHWSVDNPAQAELALEGPLGPVAGDLLASRLDIIRGVGKAPRWLAWPYGFAEARLDSLCSVLGFRGTVSLHPNTFRPEDSAGYAGRFTLTAKSTIDRISLVFPTQ